MLNDFIDIVICTQNRIEILTDCLKSLEASKNSIELIHQIYVVDSSTDPIEAYKCFGTLKIFSKICHIVLPPTYTLPKKRNYFLRNHFDSSRNVLFIDDDVLIEYSTLFSLARAMSQDEVQGIGGKDLYYRSLPRTPVFFPSVLGSEKMNIGELMISGRNIQYFAIERASDVEWLAGNFMAYKGSAIKNLYFDESRQFIGEDVHFSFSVARNGKLIACPEVEYRHLNSGGSTSFSHHKYRDYIDHRIALVFDFPKRVKLRSTLFSLFLELILELGHTMKICDLKDLWKNLWRFFLLIFYSVISYTRRNFSQSKTARYINNH